MTSWTPAASANHPSLTTPPGPGPRPGLHQPRPRRDHRHPERAPSPRLPRGCALTTRRSHRRFCPPRASDRVLRILVVGTAGWAFVLKWKRGWRRATFVPRLRARGNGGWPVLPVGGLASTGTGDATGHQQGGTRNDWIAPWAPPRAACSRIVGDTTSGSFELGVGSICARICGRRHFAAEPEHGPWGPGVGSHRRRYVWLVSVGDHAR